MFSFKHIVRIDNLHGLEKLVKLQLDNNMITKIENLDHLIHLQWLDLSFNQVCGCACGLSGCPPHRSSGSRARRN